LLPGGFLVRGKIKVGAEVSLAHLGYNLKRALSVLGLEKLLAALKDFKPSGPQAPRTANFGQSGLVGTLTALTAPLILYLHQRFTATFLTSG
jgi:hypothetical protein